MFYEIDAKPKGHELNCNNDTINQLQAFWAINSKASLYLNKLHPQKMIMAQGGGGSIDLIFYDIHTHTHSIIY